jgi:hypothetical protein
MGKVFTVCHQQRAEKPSSTHVPPLYPLPRAREGAVDSATRWGRHQQF